MGKQAGPVLGDASAARWARQQVQPRQRQPEEVLRVLDCARFKLMGRGAADTVGLL